MKGITTDGGSIHMGALTTFADFEKHPAIIELIPHIHEYTQKIASVLIRQRATIGGNIITASPIGDLSVLLLAFEVSLVLQAGNHIRTIPLRDFFCGYKQTTKTADEILTEIVLPLPAAETSVNFEKVSKRHYLDCAAVNSAISLRCAGDTILDISISMGGVAPIPLFLKQTSCYFRGKQVTKEVVAEAFEILQGEISPISDIHGSAHYKRLLARQLLIAHFTQLCPELITVQDFYRAIYGERLSPIAPFWQRMKSSMWDNPLPSWWERQRRSRKKPPNSFTSKPNSFPPSLIPAKPSTKGKLSAHPAPLSLGM
jgi:xanthine dehydrogenase small subunit